MLFQKNETFLKLLWPWKNQRVIDMWKSGWISSAYFLRNFFNSSMYKLKQDLFATGFKTCGTPNFQGNSFQRNSNGGITKRMRCQLRHNGLGSKFITDGQTDRQILWHHICGYTDFFSQLNLLPPYSLCSQGD